tara:strand:- start:6800 stop:7558 length:759 start_codon:yes stop_codon:yes gene_type:complete
MKKILKFNLLLLSIIISSSVFSQSQNSNNFEYKKESNYIPTSESEKEYNKFFDEFKNVKMYFNTKDKPIKSICKNKPAYTIDCSQEGLQFFDFSEGDYYIKNILKRNGVTYFEINIPFRYSEPEIYYVRANSFISSFNMMNFFEKPSLFSKDPMKQVEINISNYIGNEVLIDNSSRALYYCDDSIVIFASSCKKSNAIGLPNRGNFFLVENYNPDTKNINLYSQTDRKSVKLNYITFIRITQNLGFTKKNGY